MNLRISWDADHIAIRSFVPVHIVTRTPLVERPILVELPEAFPKDC
jgi:hypothetical protein